MTWKAYGIAFFILAGTLIARAQDPFAVTAELAAGSPPTVKLSFTVPEHHYLYVHAIQVSVEKPEGVTLKPVNPPKPSTKYDKMLDETIAYYGHDTVLTYAAEGLKGEQLTLTVAYQGCDATTCFMPQERRFVLTAGGGSRDASSASAPVSEPAAKKTAPEDWQELARQFEVIGTGTGYLNPKDFLTFLRQSESGTAPQGNLLQTIFRRYGILVAFLVVIPLGLLLNLTPCVLPMIPINLAIIGAGNAAGAKRTGFLRGLAYGFGMALVYGLLGLIVVLTGSQFGALNASPWFSFGIAGVFVLLGLAMFDVFMIDLSRFQKAGSGAGGGSKSPFITAFILGGTAALLAGACVAPVLIWVLVLATDLYTKGTVSGLLLPFMLGIGMALPWPIAGAGMAIIPRPGGWMNKVKYGFGVLIFIFAVYYAMLGVKQLGVRSAEDEIVESETQGEAAWMTHLETGLHEAIVQKKPVLLDFWALSCKSCKKMKRTTFPDPEVVEALEGYVKIAVQTDKADDPTVRGAVTYYHVMGLPTYVVLRLKDQP